MRWIRSNLGDVIFLIIVGGAFIYFGRTLFGGGSVTSGWETDFDKFSVPVEEIISGGVGRDGIPPIDNPFFAPVADAQWLQPQSPIIALEVNGDARAYPLGVLTRHEIVNDEVGGIPVAVTFCPLCNSAIVYDRRVDGEVLRFGVSGNLRNSDLVMWDDKSQSWWQQLTGEGIVGEYTGTLLNIVPSQMIGFGTFVERYPDGQVLSNDAGFSRNPYVGYDSNPQPFLYRGPIDSRLFATERVLAGLVDDQPIAYPFPELAEQFVINDQIGDVPVVAFWQPGATSALDQSDIDGSKDVGMALLYRAELDGKPITFHYEDGIIRDDLTESTWNIFGEAVSGSLEGSKLEQLNAFPHFWFTWAAFHPDTLLYGE